MNRLLSKLGLMRVSEHETLMSRMTIGRDDWKASAEVWQGRFKTAISDLAAAREEITSLRPDAEAMRRKRQMDRDRRANNRKGKA